MRETYLKTRENGGERAKKKSERHCSVHKQRTGRRVKQSEGKKKEQIYCMDQPYQAHLHGMTMITDTDQ